MDYILLVLIVILFLNKQNKDRLIKHNYTQRFYDADRVNNAIGNKYKKLTKNKYLKNEERRDKKNIQEKSNINNCDNTIKTMIKNYEEDYEVDNYIKNNDLKNDTNSELDEIEIDENAYSKNQYENLERSIEIEEDHCEDNKNIFKTEEKYISELERSKEENYNTESSYNAYNESKRNEKEYSDLNDNQQYRVLDIYEDNQELKESKELYKEIVINNINNKIVDNINAVITYRDDKEIYKRDNKVYKEDKEAHKKDKITYKQNKETYKRDKKMYKEEVNKDSNFEKNKNKFNELKKMYKGVNVSVLVSGVGIIEGEIVFDFPNIIAVKNKEDIIIFINESKILGIY